MMVRTMSSSYAAPDGNSDCVEVARLANGLVLLRDSKNHFREPPVFTSDEWDVFTQAIRDGEFEQDQL